MGENAAAEVRRAALAFFLSCMALVDQAGASEENKGWETRIGLLEIVDQEMLLGSIGVLIGEEADAVLRRNGDIALEALVSISQGESSL